MNINYIHQKLGIPEHSIQKTIQLFTDGATIPFVARYRKEFTGGLNEVELAHIHQMWREAQDLEKRKVTVIKSITEQGKLTPDLEKRIEKCNELLELEDIYLPFKQKRKTKASIAIEKGLEPLAKKIFEQKVEEANFWLKSLVPAKFEDKEEVLQGARDIVAEWINENVDSRNTIRKIFNQQAFLISKVKKAKKDTAEKYLDYFDFSESLKKIPSHRVLAILRGENEGFLSVKIDVSKEDVLFKLQKYWQIRDNWTGKEFAKAIEESYDRLLFPSIENEYLQAAKLKADKEAIEIFATNLKQLLLAAPLGDKRILAIDPGFKTGCKVVVLNETGNLLDEMVIFPFLHTLQAQNQLENSIVKHKIEAIGVGNGTAGRETEEFIKKNILHQDKFKHIPCFMVSEQGASIYSASEIAREEFPDKDITVRGAVSIGRRLKDPLAELVKLDPKSIGVGQYQHDISAKLLSDSLQQVVENCVNSVGVDVNLASKSLLSYVSGLGPSLAQNIIEYRNSNGKIKNRGELKKVPKLGPKAFEQAAGFLRVRDAKNPLDNSAVHPEAYPVVEKMAKDSSVSVEELIGNKNIRSGIEIQKYISDAIGLPTLQDIMAELEKPGRDPRAQLEEFSFANVHSIEDLSIGMIVPGIVTNITAFGCFVDIGVHQDGLIHISQLANKFIQNPNEIVSLNQKISVKIIELDVKRKRISLSSKDVPQNF